MKDKEIKDAYGNTRIIRVPDVDMDYNEYQEKIRQIESNRQLSRLAKDFELRKLQDKTGY